MTHSANLYLGSIIIVVALAIQVITMIWLFRDARARGRSGCLIAALALILSAPTVAIMWLLLRPSSKHR